MNFSRALTSLLSASSKHRLLRAPVAALHPHLFSTKASQNKRLVQKKVKPSPVQDELRADLIMNLKRPLDIPFQPRVANTVQLIGTVGVPVQKQTLTDGRVTAVSVLIQEKYPDLPKVWIPIIFQGELAEVAAAYLKENDTVYITGQLNGHTEPVKVNENQANIQVLAHTLNYVVDSGPDSFKHTRDAGAELDAPMIKEREDSVSYTEAEIADNLMSLQLWSDLLNNPSDWYDNRAKKTPGMKTPDFRHKKTKQVLWINESTPSWVISKLEEPPFGSKNPISSPKQGAIKKPNTILWNDVVANPQNWVDNRMDKHNGLLKVKFPDFKNKVTKDALWIDTAPSLILEQLDRLEFANNSVSRGKPFSSNGAQIFSKSSSSNRSETHFWKNGGTGVISKDALWKDLVDNPKNWWDNRSNKLKPNHPDFKHKDNGEGLWISKTTPQWILAKLPSGNVNGKKSGTDGAASDVPNKSFRTTLLS